MKYFILIFVFLILNQFSFSQDKKDKKPQYRHISFDFGNGYIMPTTDFVNGVNLEGSPIKNYQSYSLLMLWQNPGYTNWQQALQAPYYGFGATLNNFFNAKELGFPVSVYGILGIPIKKWSRFQIYSEFQVGVAFGWKHYEKENNEYNLAIGSSMTAHVTIGFNALYQINDYLDIQIGADFVHFSNGAMKRPNRGMNIISPSVRLNYHFGKRSLETTFDIKDPKIKKRSLLLMVGYGNHQLVEYELSSSYFAIGQISAIYLEQLTQSFRLGAGTDVGYWFRLNANDDGIITSKDTTNLTIGLILQPEIIIGRLTLVGGVGIYARHKDYGNFSQMYQRLGVRIDLYKNISFGVNVRAISFTRAEFMEFNLAYRFDWDK